MEFDGFTIAHQGGHTERLAVWGGAETQTGAVTGPRSHSQVGDSHRGGTHGTLTPWLGAAPLGSQLPSSCPSWLCLASLFFLVHLAFRGHGFGDCFRERRKFTSMATMSSTLRQLCSARLLQLWERTFVQNNAFGAWKRANSTPPSPTAKEPQPPRTVVLESQLVGLGVPHGSDGRGQATLPRARGPPPPGGTGAPSVPSARFTNGL